MKELFLVDSIKDARVLLNPTRLQMLGLLRKPMVLAALAAAMRISAQRANNHIRQLLAARFIEVVAKRSRGHLTERTFQSVAKTFWLSQRLVRIHAAGDAPGHDRASHHNLLQLAESLHEDAAALLDKSGAVEVPSLGFSSEIQLRDAEERRQFAIEYLRLFNGLMEKYQRDGTAETRFKITLVGYPTPG